VLLGAFALDLLLYGLVVPFLPERAAQLGASPTVTGALFAAYAGGLFIATPPAGWLTDHVGARRTMLAGLGALLAATLLFAFAPDLPLLFAARAAQGASAAVTWTAGLALIAQLYGPGERERVFARVFMATGLGTLIGPPLGGVLYSLGGFRLPFLVAGGLVLLDGLGRLFFIPGRDTLQVERPAPGAARALLRHPLFVLGMLATLAGAAVFALLEPILAPLMAARYGWNALMTGLLFAGVTLIYTAVQPLAVWMIRQRGAQLTIIIGLIASAVGVALLGFAPTLVFALVALAIITLGVTLILAPSLELLTTAGDQSAAQRNQQVGVDEATAAGGGVPHGTLYAAYNLAWAGGILLGPLLSGIATDALGTAAGLGVVALFPLALSLLMTRKAR
jgi:MFS family permease